MGQSGNSALHAPRDVSTDWPVKWEFNLLGINRNTLRKRIKEWARLRQEPKSAPCRFTAHFFLGLPLDKNEVGLIFLFSHTPLLSV